MCACTLNCPLRVRARSNVSSLSCVYYLLCHHIHIFAPWPAKIHAARPYRAALTPRSVAPCNARATIPSESRPRQKRSSVVSFMFQSRQLSYILFSFRRFGGRLPANVSAFIVSALVGLSSFCLNSLISKASVTRYGPDIVWGAVFSLVLCWCARHGQV